MILLGNWCILPSRKAETGTMLSLTAVDIYVCTDEGAGRLQSTRHEHSIHDGSDLDILFAFRTSCSRMASRIMTSCALWPRPLA